MSHVKIFQAGLTLSSRGQVYARARRHSWLVWTLKRLIPFGSLAAIALLVSAAFFGKMQGLSLGPISLSGTKVTMELPRMTGFRNDNRPYEVTAVEAQQDIRHPNVVELKDLKAKIPISESGAARLEASFGVLDTQKEFLDLHQNVRVKTDTGYDAQFKSAFIDFKAGTVVSKDPVRVGLTNGEIQADRVSITENGKVIVFEGRVKSTFSGADSKNSQAMELRK